MIKMLCFLETPCICNSKKSVDAISFSETDGDIYILTKGLLLNRATGKSYSKNSNIWIKDFYDSVVVVALRA